MKGHENILELHGYTILTNHTVPALVSHWCENGNLKEYVAKANPPIVTKLKLVRRFVCFLPALTMGTFRPKMSRLAYKHVRVVLFFFF